MENIREFTLRNVQKALSWMVYFSSTVLFRLEIWILLCAYLVEFVAPIILAQLVINFSAFCFLQRDVIKFDPVLGTILSLVYPTAYTRCTHNFDSAESERRFNKEVHTLLAIAGNIMLSK